MKQMILAGSLLGMLAASAANVWWVDDDNYGQSGLDGTTAAKAFGTIQDALDNPDFAAGDTVKVLPGVYDRGESVCPTEGGSSNRVTVTKACTIMSTDGKEVTHIVGYHSELSANGIGSNAVRCVASEIGTGVRIEGFTLRDGATAASSGGSAFADGGAVKGFSTRGLVIADCTVSNCIARKGGATQNATLVRCLVTRNVSTGTENSVNNQTTFYSCIVADNKGTAASTCDAVATTFCCNSTTTTTGGGSYYNCLLTDNGGSEWTTKPKYYSCTCTATNGHYQVMAPVWGDYRPVLPAAIGGGDATYFAKYTTVPDADRYLDYDGRAVPQTGACDIGAIQGRGVTAPYGALVSGGNLIVDGKSLPSGDWIYAETYPTQWNVTATVPDGQWLWGYSRGSVTANRQHPDLEGRTLVMPPMSGVVTNTPLFASYARWVNPDKDIGDDANDGTQAAPFRTLQKAIDSAPDKKYTMIFAAPGVYDEGGRNIAEGQSNGSLLTNRVCATTNDRYVRLIGAGAGKSFIAGAPDPTTGGDGRAAVRPVGVYCNYFTIQGFTLTNGYGYPDSSRDENHYGAAYGRTISGVQLLDCEVTDCRGNDGCLNVVSLIRCRVHGNESEDTLANGVRLISCLVESNRTVRGVINSTAINSTFRGADSDEVLSYATGNSMLASVFETAKSLGGTFSGSLVWNCGVTSGLAGTWVEACPVFAGPVNGDSRVRALSAARTCVGPWTAEGWKTNYWLYATSDLVGRPLALASGMPVAGCRQELVMESGLYVTADKGGLSGLAEGWNAVADTFTLTPCAAERPCFGYTVNGVTNLFDQVPSRTFSAAECAGGLWVEALYADDWYVDANAEDDTGLGYTPGTAKRTFAGLFGTGEVLSGDTVHAAEGVYTNGVMTFAEKDAFDQAYTVGSRVIVPEGVTVVADGRTEETIIRGAPAATDPTSHGIGVDAVRCVSLRPNSRICGFTLEGGHTAGKKGLPGWTGETPKSYRDNIGGAVLGTSSSEVASEIVDRCILRDCVAYRGGGAAYATLCRCRVTGMRGTDSSGNASSTYRSRHYGTVIINTLSRYAVMYAGSFDFSTLVDGDFANSLYQPLSLIGSIVCGETELKSGSTLQIRNSLLTSAQTGGGSLTDGSAVVTRESLALDAEGRPGVTAGNPAVDAGLADLFAASLSMIGDGETDASGGQRVYNGRLDVGALEADWRETYARDITPSRRFAVTAATTNVTEAAGCVRLNPGQSLTALWQSRSGIDVRHCVTVRVSGGTLTVRFGSEVREVADTAGEDVTLEFSSAEAENGLSFSYAGEGGWAEIVRAKRDTGMLLFVR